MLPGRRFAGVLLRDVAHRRQVLVAVQGVVVQVDLGVQGQQVAVLGDDQGVDLHQAGIAVGEQSVQACHQLLQFPNLAALQAQTETQLAALVGLQAGGRVDVGGEDLLGRVGGHLFDVHPPGRRGHKQQPSPPAVHQHTQIEFARRRGRQFHQQVVDR